MKGIKRGSRGLGADEIVDFKLQNISNIIQQISTILKTARYRECRTVKGRKQAYDNIVNAGINALVVIGGDGTIAGASDFAAEYNLPVIALPDTIDNAPSGTDATIGYDSALNTIINAVDKLRDIASSHERLFFVKVMGHTADHLTLNGVIASGAEVTTIPEIETEVDQLAELIGNGFRKNKNSAIVLVTENPQTGEAMGLAERVKKEFPQYDARAIILGHLQRDGFLHC